MPKRTAILPLLALAASAAAAIPIMGFAAPANSLPDLRSDPPTRPILDDVGDRLLLRFDGYVTNVGYGPLDVTGNPSANQMRQRRANGSGGFTDVQAVPVKYETADGHNHFHLMNAMRYSLRRADSTAQVAPAQKVGFCLYDLSDAAGAPVQDDQFYEPTNFCQVGNPSATYLSMGVSAGWRDDYSRDLALQWVDVSNTPPGAYRIAAESDPLDVVDESNEGNNGFAFTNYTLPGHVAQPVGPVAVPGGAGARTVTLNATTYGAAGTRVFRVTAAPAHGTLNVAVGQTIAGNQVQYTPAAGYSGPDSFQYVAASTSGPGAGFPTNPAAATASIQVGPSAAVPTVAISGAPASLVAGTSAQLQAVVAPAGPVTWTATAGTIDANGLYVAPGTPPPGGTVTIRATSVAAPSVFAEASIAITPIPVPIPTPGGGATGVPGPGPGGATPGLMSKPRVTRGGRIVVVRTTPRANGRILVTAIRGGKAVSRCRIAARAGKRATCRVRLPARFAKAPVRVAVKLSAAGGQKAVAGALVRAR